MADPATTKRSLLDAGRQEFAAFGLAGARTDRIAAASGVNKQRIYAYFGSKEGMFDAVLSDALDALLDLVPLPEGELSSGEFVAAYVDAVSTYHRDHPHLLRLLQWESLERGPAGTPSDGRAAHYREKIDAFAQRLDIPPDRAAPLLFGVIGLAAWPHMVPQLGSLITGSDEAMMRREATRWASRAAAAVADDRLLHPAGF